MLAIIPFVLATQPLEIVLRNSGMEQGFDKPAGWEHVWTGQGKVAASRDTEFCRTGQASLRLDLDEANSKGQVSQWIPAEPGRKVRLTGSVFIKGNLNVTLGVQPLDDNNKPIEFQVIGNTRREGEWIALDGTVTLPAGTKQFAFALLAEGQGKVWLDETRIYGDGTRRAEFDFWRVPPPKRQDPTVPMYGYFPEYPDAWIQMHRSFNERSREGKVDVVFIGDSITQGWNKQVWNREIAPLNAANYGIGGDRTQQLLWRIENGNLNGISPKVVVLMIGINNTWGDTFGPKKIADGIAAVVGQIRTRQPQAKVLLLGVLPALQKPTDGTRETVRKINAEAAKLQDNRKVFFLDMGSKFLEPDGTISKSIMPDYLHLSEAGYEIWWREMGPTLKRLLAESS